MASMTQRARQVLEQADRGLPDTPARQRLLDALWDDDPAAWTRLLVGEDDIHSALVPTASVWARDPLAHVIRAGELVADCYGREHLEPAALAIGLALTARAPDPMVQLIAVESGFGHLENLPGLRHYVESVLDGFQAHGDDEPADAPEPFAGVLRRGLVIDRAVMTVSVVARVLLALSLMWRAFDSHGWLFAVAPLVLVSTAPRSLAEERLSRPWVIDTKVPWLPLIALLLAGLDEHRLALVTLGCWVVVSAGVHLAEHAVVTHYWALASAVGKIDRRLRNFPRQLASGLSFPRLAVLLATVAAASATYLAVSPWSDTAAAAAAVTSALAAVWSTRGNAAVQRWTGGVALLSVFLPHVDLIPTVCAFAVAALTAWATRRSLRPRLLNPLQDVRLSRRLRALGRLVAQGHARAALIDLGEDAEPGSLYVTAWAYLELGQPGRARATVRAESELAESLFGRYIALAAANRLGEALKSPPGLAEGGSDVTILHNLEVLRARFNAGEEPEKLAVAALDLMPRVVTPRAILQTAAAGITAARFAQEVSSDLGIAIAFKVASMVMLPMRQDLTDLEEFDSRDDLILRERRLWTVSAQASAIWLTAPHTASRAELLEQTGAEGLGRTLAYTLDPLEHAQYAEVMARRTEEVSGQPTDESLAQWVQVLATLNVARHHLTDPSDREHWWAHFEEILELTVRRAAARRDWRALAEVLEVARLQLHDPQDSTAQASAVSLSLKGRSLFDECQYPFGGRPPLERFEDVVARAVGADGYWWSTWVVGTDLYWALVPQDSSEPVQGGMLSESRWSSATHRELKAWLPLPQPGEIYREMMARVATGPMSGLPGLEELHVARAWGRVLPPAILDRPSPGAGSSPEPRLRLGMALCRELSHVPWAWTCIGNEQRLIEVSDLVVVPPASLIKGSGSTGQMPLAAAILNPAGDMPNVEELADVVPDGVTLQRSGEPDPRGTFTKIMAETPRASTVLIACHTDRDYRGQLGLEIGNPLDAGSLVTFDVLTKQDGDIALPEQVLAMACESAGLADMTRGEWTVLGAGLLSAGAHRAVVTAFLHPNVLEIDRKLIQALAEKGSLSEALGHVQRTQLDKWRSGDQAACPIRWAGMQIFGSIGIESADRAGPQWVEEALIEQLDQAANDFGHRDGHVGVGEFLSSMYFYGYADEASTQTRLRTLLRKATLVTRSLSGRKRRRAVEKFRITNDLMSVLEEARQITHQHGGQVISLESVLIAALRHEVPEARRFQRIMGWHPQSPAFVDLMLPHREARWYLTGEVAGNHLAPGEQDRIYAHLGVPRPMGPDRWHSSERLN